MIVFFSILSIIFIIMCLCIAILKFSIIKVKLINFKIKDFKDLETIVMLIKKKEYVRIFEYVDFKLKLQIYFFNKIIIFTAKVTDEKIEKFLRKQIRKNKLKKEERELKKFEEEDKKQIKKDVKKIELEKLDLFIEIGTENASITAIGVTTLNVLIASFLPFIVYKEHVREKINIDNYKYQVNPVYIDKSAFYINISLVLSIPIINLLNLIK